MRTGNSGKRKQVVILGATGSIGEIALKVARDIPDRMQIVGLAANSNAEMVLVAIVGTGGLRPALAAVEAGKDLAVASKEILVMAGEIVMREARENGVHVLTVDSEHNAIFQCLEGRSASEVRRIILTASGGPFREAARKD